MKILNQKKQVMGPIIILLILTIIITTGTSAQGGPSFSMSFATQPYQDFKDPIRLDDGSTIDNAQAKLNKTKASFSYPFVFSEGRTVLVNEFSYQLIEFEYKNFIADYPLKRLHAGSYTLMLQHKLSQRWSTWLLATPSLTSDLKAEVSEDDFNFQAVAIFIRHYSERFSLGFGAAYSTQFGSAVPLPVLAVDWNNGENLMLRAIFPTSIELWYRTSPKIDIGLLVSGDGNNFHGDPELYLKPNPELRYTMLTIGPAARITLSKIMKLNIESGVIGLHRFEFYDSDTEHGSYDLDPNFYFKFGFTIGQ